jgi:hypothetical protein
MRIAFALLQIKPVRGMKARAERDGFRASHIPPTS